MDKKQLKRVGEIFNKLGGFNYEEERVDGLQMGWIDVELPEDDMVEFLTDVEEFDDYGLLIPMGNGPFTDSIWVLSGVSMDRFLVEIYNYVNKEKKLEIETFILGDIDESDCN